jgi:hypothetical protein
MPQTPLLDPDFVRFLRERREELVPFTGAGVSVDAGVPIADELALPIASKANEAGAGVHERAEFEPVCAEVIRSLGRERLQEVIAAVIREIDPQPTPLLRLIARAPSKIVLTSNWDDALEKSAVEVGLSPRSFEPRMVAALGQPAEHELYVVHLHGMASAPDSIVMPGEFLEALRHDEAFVAGLRALLASHSLLYLGYSFPREDVYLRDELIWIAGHMRGVRAHGLLVPEREYAPRVDELRALREANFRIATFDSTATTGYESVTQAALVLAPTLSVVASQVTRRPDRHPSPYFLAPRIVVDDQDKSRDEVQQAIEMARAGFGDLPFLDPVTIEEGPRSVVVGEPGSGKSELLLQLMSQAEPPHLYLRLPEVAERLLEEDIEQAFALAMTSAAAVGVNVATPTREALAGNAYVVFLDGFDELTEPATRLALSTRIDEIADRWPQNRYVIATRPVGERSGFPEERWTCFRLVGDVRWGREYLLETRAIPERRVDDLFAQFPRANELIAIPLYATLIGERLARDEELPPNALKLITDVGVRDALSREADRAGLARADVYRFLKTLASAMELRALNQAPTNELVEVPAPPGLAREEVRDRLIEQALLRDVAGVAEFQAVSVQEALAAEAILETADPIETLRRTALAEVSGEQVLRPDIDHTLDLLFESAAPELRTRLREIEELRWARTQPATITEAEAEETLRFIWAFFTDARIWVDTDRGRELRDARAAVERLAASFPQAIAAMREQLIEVSRSDEETTRGNAVFFLEQVEDDPDRAEWLRPRLTDDNQVVRRWAAEVVRRRGVVQLRDALTDAYLQDREESSAGTLGNALLAIAPEAKRVETARILLRNPLGWSRVSYSVRRLPPGEVVEILQAGDLRRFEDEHLLRDVLEDSPVEAWDEAAVESLIELIVRQGSRTSIRVRAEDRIVALVDRFPDAALRGARRGASDETLWIDLMFLERLPREALEDAREGTLAAPLTKLLERIDYEAQHHEQQQQPQEVRHLEREREEPQLAEWIDSGKINAERCVDPQGPLDRLVKQVDSLSPQQRITLADCARAWLPDPPLRDRLQTDGRSGTRPGCLDSALAFHAALDLEIPVEMWLEIYESNAIWFERSAANWVARHYPGESVDDRVLTHIKTLAEPSLISIALDCLPELTPEVADGAARTLAPLEADSTYILDRFREANQRDALRHLENNAVNEMTRSAARRELATAGDLAAQRDDLARTRQAILNGADLLHGGPDWLQNAHPDLLPDIEETFVAVAHRVAPSEWEIGRALAATLERFADERGVAFYDSLIHDSEAIAGPFYWHQQRALAGEIARRKKLAELPPSLRGVAELLVELGYDTERVDP